MLAFVLARFAVVFALCISYCQELLREAGLLPAHLAARLLPLVPLLRERALLHRRCQGPGDADLREECCEVVLVVCMGRGGIEGSDAFQRSLLARLYAKADGDAVSATVETVDSTNINTKE